VADTLVHIKSALPLLDQPGCRMAQMRAWRWTAWAVYRHVCETRRTSSVRSAAESPFWAIPPARRKACGLLSIYPLRARWLVVFACSWYVL